MSEELKTNIENILYSYIQVLEEHYGQVRHKELPDAISQIEQAFKDAGYKDLSAGSCPHDNYLLKHVDNRDKCDYCGKPRVELLTGQEWYDRFDVEYREVVNLDDRIDFRNPDVLSAARKAAGLEG